MNTLLLLSVLTGGFSVGVVCSMGAAESDDMTALWKSLTWSFGACAFFAAMWIALEVGR